METSKDKLRKFINHDFTLIIIFFLIVLSIGFTILEFITPQIYRIRLQLYDRIQYIITFVFIIELSIRWYVSPSFKQFCNDCWMDVLAILPLIRPLRILRLLRLLRLVGWGVRVRRMRKMTILGAVLAENLLIVLILFVVIVGSTIGMMIAEPQNQSFDSLSEAIWWSVLTLMAGEPILGEPSSTPGKFITMIVMMGGFTLFAMFTGVVSAFMTKRLKEDKSTAEAVLKGLKNHYIICGWNRSAPSIIKELQANSLTRKKDIVIVTEQIPSYSPISGFSYGDVLFVEDDYTSADVLNRVQVHRAAGAIFIAGKEKPRKDQDRDARTILAALTIEKMYNGSHRESIYSCVELLNRDLDKQQVLEDAGVEDIIEGDEFMGHLIAHSIHANGLIQVIDELLTSTWGNEFQLINSEVSGNFKQILKHYKKRHDILVLGMSKERPPLATDSLTNDNAFEINPAANVKIQKGQQLLAISAHKSDLKNIPQKLTKSNIQAEIPAIPIDQVDLDNIQGHYILCGWNRSAPKIIRELQTNHATCKNHIVVITEAPELPMEIKTPATTSKIIYISGDYTANKVLEKARVKHAKSAILLADKSDIKRSDQDRDARNILAALTIEKHNNNIETCVELLNRDEEKIKILQIANVENIVVGDEYLGNLIAHSTRTHGLARALAELLTSNQGNEFKKVPLLNGESQFIGKTYKELMIFFKEHYNAIVLAIETHYRVKPASQIAVDRPFYLTNPPPDYIIKDTDNLFLICPPEDQA